MDSSCAEREDYEIFAPFVRRGDYGGIFVLLCRLFSYMLEMKIDPDDIFITKAECEEHLCNKLPKPVGC